MTIILDSGHGGSIDNIYQTPGKRSPIFDDGTQLFEGVLNRQIKYRLIEYFEFYNIPYIDVSPGDIDISLDDRVNNANEYYLKNNNCFYLSLHSNAGGGTGSEVYIANNASQKSLEIAQSIEKYHNLYYDIRFRGIKNKNFHVLAKTYMPSVLVEYFFFDNEKECRTILQKREGRDYIAYWIFNSLKKFLK